MLGDQGVGVLPDGKQGRVLGLLPSAAKPDTLEQERAAGAGAVEAVDEEGGSGGAAGAEVHRWHSVGCSLERRPRVEEVEEEEVRAELIEQRANAWCSEVACALERRHEPGWEVLGGV